MENVKDTYRKSEHSNNANSTSHYTLMTIGILIVMAGTFLRFMTWSNFIDIISNILLVVGVVICFKSVFNILK